MKHLFSILFGVLLVGSTKAQIVEPLLNGGFEQWDTIDGYSEPRNWYTLNSLTNVGFDPTTELTTDAHSGSFAVKLISKEGSFADLSGVLSTGPILDEQFQPDFNHIKMAFNKRPAALRFYYKSNFLDPDTSQGAFILTKWNATTQTADSIGSATFQISQNFNTYQLAVINFEYYATGLPDSAYFIASSSSDAFNPKIGSALYLDDIALLYYNSNVAESEIENSISIWPNPAKSNMNLTSTNTLGSVKIFNNQGKLVFETNCNQKSTQIDLSLFSNGLYLVEIENDLGKLTKKVIVE